MIQQKHISIEEYKSFVEKNEYYHLYKKDGEEKNVKSEMMFF